MTLEAPLAWLPLDLFISAHYEFAIDEGARRASPDPAIAARSRFCWWELGISLRLDVAGERPRA